LIAFTLIDFTLIAWPLEFTLRRRDGHARAIAALHIAAACGCCGKKPTIDDGFLGGGSDGATREDERGGGRRSWALPAGDNEPTGPLFQVRLLCYIKHRVPTASGWCPSL
jgi:hypothetical protein